MARVDEQRRFQRFKGRVPCIVREGEQEGRGFVTDLSANGLFLQTQKKLAAGSKVILTLDHERSPPLFLTGTVTRTRKSHRAAGVVMAPGYGVELESAPEEYFRIVMDLNRET